MVVALVFGGGCRANTPPPPPATPAPVLKARFFDAVGRNDVAEVKRLLTRELGPDAMNPNGNTPLLIAAREGETELVRALIQAHANVNLRRGNSWDENTPLLIAGALGHDEIVHLLIDAGTHVNARRGDG